jgi:hypothetical protein
MLPVWDVMQRALTRHVSLAKDECFAYKRTDMTQPLQATPASFAVASRMTAWPVNLALALAGGLALRSCWPGAARHHQGTVSANAVS